MNKKQTIVARGLAGYMILMLGGNSVLAVDFPDATNGTSEVKATIELGEGGGPTIPPIDPGEVDPGVIDPEITNPNEGPLALRYVSNIEFEPITVSTKSQIATSKKDTNTVNGAPVQLQAVVQDFRGNDTRDGWELKVKQSGTFVAGTELKLSPWVPEAVAEDYHTPQRMTVNTEAQIFAQTMSSGNPAGIIAISMAGATEDIELVIPANTPVGEYSMTLTWTLDRGPVGTR